jgi:HPt (histidine-containing phosphotransfer) domain-containing protein
MPGWFVRSAALTAFLALLVISSAWEMHARRHDGELRLQQDAQSLAKRASLHLAGVSWEMDAPAARGFIFVEMEDLRLAAMLIYDRTGLLEGMRRNNLWEVVPWDDLMPENCVEAAAPVMMEDVQVGEVILYLSRRALDEELSAGARREFARVAALALIPCIALALLLWRLAAHRAACSAQTPPASPAPPVSSLPQAAMSSGSKGSPVDEKREAAPAPLHLPPDWNREEVRRAYFKECRAFLREQQAGAALLCRLAAREEWGELREAARALREAALALNAPPLAAAALSVQEAALADTASAARHVERCIPVLIRVFHELEGLLRDNDEAARGEKA